MDATAIGLVTARFAHLGSLTLLFGGLLFPVYVDGLGPAPRAHRLPMFGALLVALVSGAGWFAFTSASMAGSLPGAWDPATLMEVAKGTGFGALWLTRTAALVVLAGLLLAPGPVARRLAIGVSAAALASLAWTGHANGDEGALASFTGSPTQSTS